MPKSQGLLGNKPTRLGFVQGWKDFQDNILLNLIKHERKITHFLYKCKVYFGETLKAEIDKIDEGYSSILFSIIQVFEPQKEITEKRKNQDSSWQTLLDCVGKFTEDFMLDRNQPKEQQIREILP